MWILFGALFTHHLKLRTFNFIQIIRMHLRTCVTGGGRCYCPPCLNRVLPVFRSCRSWSTEPLWTGGPWGCWCMRWWPDSLRSKPTMRTTCSSRFSTTTSSTPCGSAKKPFPSWERYVASPHRLLQRFLYWIIRVLKSDSVLSKSAPHPLSPAGAGRRTWQNEEWFNFSII